MVATAAAGLLMRMLFFAAIFTLGKLAWDHVTRR